METNVLYYGDNLDILRKYLPDESVDLVYLDPPFNSNRDYNIIFKDESGRNSDAQLLAFEDTWHWGPSVAQTYDYLTNSSLNKGKVPDSVSTIIGALRKALGTNQMMAYLVEMTVRLVELRRTLTSTGSLWLHCDPTASHYLKLILDAVFGVASFRNEVIWHYDYGARSKRTFGTKHDVLFWYSRSATEWTFNADAVLEPFKSKMTEWRYTKGGQAGKEMPAGKVPSDVWDIKMNAMAKEHLGWPTQKPLALLERIVTACSRPDDIVLDPFCGCGTALVAAQKGGRRWVGIDITHLSIAVMRARLRDSFPALGDVKVIGQPTEVEGARMLAAQSLDGRYEFQYWALSLVDAQPVGGAKKKGADSGIDGVITFTDEGGNVRQVLVSVKSGGVNVSHVRDLIGTMKREAAPLGLFLTLDEPSKPMKVEAASAEPYHSILSGKDYPGVQILSVRELLEGRAPDLPKLVMPTFQQADKVEQESPGQEKLFD